MKVLKYLSVAHFHIVQTTVFVTKHLKRYIYFYSF